MTVTMNDSIRIEKPIPDTSERTGTARSRQSGQQRPSAKTPVNQRGIDTQAEVMVGFTAAARTILPIEFG